MKAVLWFKICLAGLALLLPGCGQNTESLDGMVLEGASVPGTAEALEQSGNDNKGKLIFIPEELRMEDRTLRFGELVVQVPVKTAVRLTGEEEKGRALEISGGREGRAVPPRLRFVHYYVDYENELELAGAVLEELPDEVLQVNFGDNIGELSFDFQAEDKIYKRYVTVRGKDVYLLEEIQAEKDYSITSLLKQEAICWMPAKEGEGQRETSVRYNGRKGGVVCKYIELKPEAGVRFIARFQRGEEYEYQLKIYQEGSYENSSQSFTGRADGEISMQDLNFDGYADLLLDRDIVYLWNHEKQCYEEALLHIEDTSFEFRTAEPFEEQKTFWSYHQYYLGDVSKERLWQWEGNELVQKRVCVVDVLKDTVCIEIWEGAEEKLLLEQTFSQKKWEGDREFLRPIYEKFYEGLAPEGAFERWHCVKQEECQYISRKLLDEIGRRLEDGRGIEDLSFMNTGRFLSEEEIRLMAQKYIEIRVDLAEAARLGSYGMIEADVDNDGILDLLAEKYRGGVHEYPEFILYQGQENGGYVKTDGFEGFQEELTGVFCEDRNYVCCKVYDEHAWNGVKLYGYEDGQRIEAAEVCLELDSYHVQVLECGDEARRALAERTAAESIKVREQLEKNVIPVGSAEQEIPIEEGGGYRCDLNNDGEPEEYRKWIWETSNRSMSDYLRVSGEGEEIIEEILRDEARAPIMFWAENENGENVIHIIYLNGRYDYETAAYLVKGNDYEMVYRIEGKAKVNAFFPAPVPPV